MNAQVQANPAQVNLANRMALLQTGLRLTKKLPVVTASALGGSMQIPLERAGIMTGITLHVSVPVNVTVAATLSNFGPNNFFPNINYTDYAGIQRVNTSSYLLHAMNAFRHGRILGNPSTLSGVTSEGFDADYSILSVPTGVTTGTIRFSIHVPIAYDQWNDLRGAVLAQTIYGDHYLTLQLPSALVGTAASALDNVYTAGTVALNGNISVQAYQHYIMPQGQINANTLPMIDLSTIYAIEGNFKDTSNVTAGMDKYIPWPNNRSILSASHIYFNGTDYTTPESDLNSITLLGNSNTNIRELTPRLVREQMRDFLGADLAQAIYFLSSRRQPISTQLYGNVQTVLDIATAAAGAYVVSQYESTYLTGTPLPGIVQ